MSWANLAAAIGIDKPIRASTHLAMFNNFFEMANGGQGAPRIAAPNALRTDETDITKVLQPDGLGGLRWGESSGLRLSYTVNQSTSSMRIDLYPGDQLLVLAAASRQNYDDDPDDVWHGWCYAVGTSIAASSAIHHYRSTSRKSGIWEVKSNQLRFADGFSGAKVTALIIEL